MGQLSPSAQKQVFPLAIRTGGSIRRPRAMLRTLAVAAMAARTRAGPGCTDSAANNFAAAAGTDDGHCRYDDVASLKAKLGAQSSAEAYIFGGKWAPGTGGFKPGFPANQSVIDIETGVPGNPDARNGNNGASGTWTLVVPAAAYWIVQGKPLEGAPKHRAAIPTDGIDAAPLPVFEWRVHVSHSATLNIRYVRLRGAWGMRFLQGGFIYSNGGTVTATATLFAARSCAAQRGGSIYAVNQAVVTLSMVAFGKQDASKGSGVYLDTSTLSITNSTFLKVTSNQAPHGGAGVLAVGSHVRLERVVFDHCGGDASDTNSVIQFSAKDGNLCKQSQDGNPYFCHQTGDPDVNLTIIGTAFEPFDKASTVVMNTSWLETVGGCSEHPCDKGYVSADNTVGCLSAAPFAVEV